MHFHFKEWLENKLLEYKRVYNFDFEVALEQDFIKKSTYDPNKIYVVIKMLTDNKIFDKATGLPVQIMILSQENKIQMTQEIFSDLGTNSNMTAYTDNTGTFVKFTFTNPIVINNFNEMFAGYRSLLYMTCSMFIMEEVADVTNITIDGNNIYALSFVLSYTMSTDTQQYNREDSANYIAKSVKNTSGLSISVGLILSDSELTTKILGIMNEESNGNEDFLISFELNGVSITKNMKLTAFTMNTAPNQIPSTQIGFIK